MNDGPAIDPLRILVVGVGGGGGAVVARLAGHPLSSARLAVIDTDAQALGDCPVPCLRIGQAVTHGRSSGSDTERGRLCAELACDEIEALTRDHDLTFVVVGLGRGTGSGAAPIVAAIARQSGACVVSIGIEPFTLEGRQRERAAQETGAQLVASSDAIMLLANHQLRGGTLEGRFTEMDSAVSAAVLAIGDIVNANGTMRVDWSSVRDVLRGRVVIARAAATGEQRVRRALNAAGSLPFLAAPLALHQPTHVVLQVSGGPDLSLHEVADAVGALAEGADVRLGTLSDPDRGESVTVSLVAQVPLAAPDGWQR